MANELALLIEENHKLRDENGELITHNGELLVHNGELVTENGELAKRLEIYSDQISWYENKLYGRGSEKLSAAEIDQMRLFDEIERALGVEAEQDHAPSTEVPAHSRRRPVRRPLPDSLPRQERILDIPEQDKYCECGHELVRIGEESSEKLDVIPPRVQVIRTVRPKYACHHCEGSGDEERAAVRIAPVPATLIPKGIATDGLLAYIATAKFCDALPLYRQQKQFARIGVELSRSTMADWMIAVARACEPLMQALQRKLRSGPTLQIDETSIQVLGEPGRAATTKSYMWVARGGPPGEPVLIYRYAPSRGAPVAAEVLGDYRGFVQTDGYEVYDTACTREGITHVGCWAHARRGFSDAKKAAAKSSQETGAPQQALTFIAKLYRVESERASHRDADEFAATRRAIVEPLLERFHTWLLSKSEQVLPGSALGQAVSYTLAQWPKLIRYLESPQLTPDTNACERAIRPFVIGRKNWLFSGSPRGAAASATLYSLIETAKANALEPYWYLRDLFEKLPAARTTADYLALLPTPPP